MAHELLVREDNTTAFMRRTGSAPAWHGLGVQGETLADILRACPEFLDPVVVEPVFTGDGLLVDDARITRRQNSRMVLGTVGRKFVPTQDTDALDLGERLVATGDFRWETAGVLFGGRRMFFTLSVPGMEADILPGDALKGYVAFSQAHDGTLSHHFGLTPIRVVCSNTETAARNDSRSAFRKIAHTSSAKGRLLDVSDAIGAAKADFAATTEAFKRLAASPCSTDQLRKLVQRAFPAPATTVSDVKAAAKRAMAASQIQTSDPSLIQIAMAANEIDISEDSHERIFKKLEELFETGQGSGIPGVRGTLWGGFNALTEYTTHHRGRNAERRFDQVMFGQGAQINARALGVALSLAS